MTARKTKNPAQPIRPPELDRGSPVSLYQQIADLLASQIRRGDKKPFERLPSEHELIDIFGVSRVTVRQAIRTLTESGLIFARQGKGLYVAGPPIEHELGALRGFYDSLVVQGYQPRTQVLDFHREESPPSIPELKQFNGAYYRFRRLYQLEDLAIVVADVCMPEFGVTLTQEDIENYPVYTLLQNMVGRQVARASAQMSANRPPPDVAALLNLTPADAALQMERTSFDRDGMCLEHTRFYILSEMFAFQMDVTGPLAIGSGIRRVNR